MRFRYAEDFQATEGWKILEARHPWTLWGRAPGEDGSSRLVDGHAGGLSPVEPLAHGRHATGATTASTARGPEPRIEVLGL